METTEARLWDCGDGRCTDMFLEFIYIVVIPSGVILAIVFITSVLMCCHACKRKKSEVLMDEAMMLQYNSIRRASLNLRQLSKNRDTPLLRRVDREARTVSLNLEADERYRRGGRGTASAPGTLQRDKDRRHRRERHSDIFPPHHYSTPPGGIERHQSTGDLNQSDSGIQYAELNHGVTVTASLSGSQNDRLVI